MTTKRNPLAASTLSTEIALSGNQDLRCQELHNIDGRKVRLTVVSNSYKFQSSAKAELFDGNKWNEVANIAHGAMQTPEGLYSNRALTGRRDPFAADLETLFAKVLTVLR